MIKSIRSTRIYKISDKLVLELLKNMGVKKDADIRKSDLAKIKVIGMRAMRKFIREKYLNSDN